MKQEISYGKKDIHGGTDIVVCPAFCDVHVHLREPGYSYKETIRSGSLAAAAGGYTCVCAMPNLNPVPDSVDNLEEELEIIRRDAVIDVRPYGTITLGRKGLELVDFRAMKSSVAAFSDDGSGVGGDDLMREAMREAAVSGVLIAAHSEDKRYGESAQSEWQMIERDIALAGETGCAYHVCHVSSRKSVELIRDAKKRGINVTCETAPHYLLLCEDDVVDDGRFRMNPPLRSADDRAALIEGLCDGTVDMIATDHAPHSAEEKSRGFKGSVMGIVGLETAFPLLYTYLVRKGVISLPRLIELMSVNPRRRFRLGEAPQDKAIFEVGTPYTIDSSSFRSMGHSTPFDGMQVWGRCIKTVFRDKTVFSI